ncbi:MAG: hypothetical protein AUK27_03840 [Deltaproteobacteria bacterium CG2_30_66_27]|nr:MAG: hypothetical protein AUK27_03840 [Deltaproteobacteria bacterium CG2_30_66_27]
MFHPAGIPVRELDEIVLSLDEFEAIRLADLEGLYQEQAAERMSVSRPTFGRILAVAHRKVSEALVHGKTLKIEGGTIRMERLGPPRCECPRCRRSGDVGGDGEKSAPMDAEAPPCRRMRRRMGCRNVQVEFRREPSTNQEETS